LADEGAPYRFFFETKANLSRPQVQMLADAGVGWIQPGIESLQKDVLILLDKGTTPIQNVQLLKWGREFGVSIMWNILWEVPGEQDAWYGELADWLPSIAHLQAPGVLSAIRYDRFSPYFNRSAEFGLQLEPFPSYAFVYPLPPDAMRDAAYFFWNQNGGSAVTEPQRVARRRFEKVVGEWMRLWGEMRRPTETVDAQRFPALAIAEADTERIRLRDTRPETTADGWEIEGLAARVYQACDKAIAPRTLMHRLEEEQGVRTNPEALDRIVADFIARRVMLSLDGRLLSLATPAACRPYPSLYDFPGGLNLAPGQLRGGRAVDS
jgi:magnesium-protoporphyrin IX monomethyl ester (oxidative) cyclase